MIKKYITIFFVLIVIIELSTIISCVVASDSSMNTNSMNERIPVDSWIYDVLDSFKRKGFFYKFDSHIDNISALTRKNAAANTVYVMTYAKGDNFEKINRNGLDVRDIKNLLRLLVEFSKEISVFFEKELDSITMRMIELDLILKKEQKKKESLVNAHKLIKDKFPDHGLDDAFFMEWAFKKANTFFNDNNYRSSLEIISELLRRSPANIPALMIAGKCSNQMGDLVMASEFFRRVLEIDGSFVEARVARANIFRRQGKLDRAEKELEKARKSAPENDSIHYELAVLHGNSGHYSKAIIDYKRILELDPFNPTALTGIGIIYKLKKEWKKSSLYFRKAVSILPNKVWPHIEFADMLERSGKYDAALYEVQRALKINPDHVKALRLAARYHSVKGDFRKALEANLRILKISPKDIYALYSVGINYLKCGDHASSLETFRMILSINGKEIAARIGMGDSFMAKGDYLTAISHYDIALDQDTTCMPALTGKATALLWLDRASRALYIFKQALEIKPDSFLAAYGMAQTSLMTGAWHKARHYFELCKRLNPSRIFIYLELANMYSWLGQFKKAKQNLKSILDYDSQNKSAQELYKVIDQADDPDVKLNFLHLTQNQNSSETTFGTSFSGFINDSFSFYSGLGSSEYYLNDVKSQTQNVDIGLKYRLGMYTEVDLKSRFESFDQAGQDDSFFSGSMKYQRGRFKMSFNFDEGALKEDVWQVVAGIKVQQLKSEIAYRLNDSFTLSMDSKNSGYEAPFYDWAQGFYSNKTNDSNYFGMTLQYKPKKMENTLLYYRMGNGGFDQQLDSENKMFYYFTPGDERLSEFGVKYEKSKKNYVYGGGYSFSREDIDFLGTSFSVSSNRVDLFARKKITSKISLNSEYVYKKTRNSDPENRFKSDFQINF